MYVIIKIPISTKRKDVHKNRGGVPLFCRSLCVCMRVCIMRGDCERGRRKQVKIGFLYKNNVFMYNLTYFGRGVRANIKTGESRR